MRSEISEYVSKQSFMWMLQTCQYVWKITFTFSSDYFIILTTNPAPHSHAGTAERCSAQGVWCLKWPGQVSVVHSRCVPALPTASLAGISEQQGAAGRASSCLLQELFAIGMDALHFCSLFFLTGLYVSSSQEASIGSLGDKKIFFLGLWAVLFFLNPPLTPCSTLFCIFLFFLSSLCSPLYSLLSSGFSCHPTTDAVKLYNKSYTSLRDLISYLYCIEDKKSCKAINKMKIHSISINKL